MATDQLKRSNLARSLRVYALLAGPTGRVTMELTREEAQAFVDCMEWLDGMYTAMPENEKRLTEMREGLRAHVWLTIWQTIVGLSVIAALLYY